MAESVVGDIPTYAGVPKELKYKLENSGFQYISSLLGPAKPNLGKEIRDAWLEYEEGKTVEAQWIRDMDKFECMVQAHEYEQRTYGEKDLQEFQGLSSKIISSKGKEWLALLDQEREAHFSKRRLRTPVIFVIGASGIGKKTQYTLLSQTFNLQHISLDDVLRETSNDQRFPYAKFLKSCLAENVKVPTELAITLLERKINEGIEAGKEWSIVHGFPESMRELQEFEEKVQKTNYILLMKCSAEEILQRIKGLGQSSSKAENEVEIAKKIRDFQDELTDVENHPKAMGYLKEINCDGTVEEVNGLVTKAVEEFIEHAKSEK
ncbi:HD domain-containing protein 2 [Xylographa soralifera]|nr:HD domain-containing protein 2 [Xylographa soralifera]